MPADSALKVVLCWHMHQPDYRDPRTGNALQPWTYLRAIKDYTDMAAHLEMIDNACAVVNFTPILLEQLEDYNQQIKRHLHDKGTLQDPLLAALLASQPSCTPTAARNILNKCLNGRHLNFIQRHKSYRQLLEFAEYLQQQPDLTAYAGEAFFADLLVWFHLSWLGETVHRNDPRVQQLVARERHYSLEDRRALLAIIGEQINAVLPRYRALQAESRVELALSPYAHPLAPLVLDFHSAHDANPDLVLPVCSHYPGGVEQLQWQIDTGLEIFEHHFGVRPCGCWPSEGALSEAVLTQLANSGFRWTASGTDVLLNSLKASGQEPPDSNVLHQGYLAGDPAMCCFFRDDGLSDLIGFTYATWHADDAVANLIQHLEDIHRHCGDKKNAVVAIIMDGENAWEHYPNNGFYFLQALYRRLANHPKFQLTTFAQCLQTDKPRLPRLVAGSWVYGNLTTWIGNPDKNRAWDMLVAAKQQFDQVMQQNRLNPNQQQQAQRLMAVCEGSDWFWWPGNDNPPQTILDFDNLYRVQLTALYQCLGVSPPEYLALPFTHRQPSAEAPLGGVMRKTT